MKIKTYCDLCDKKKECIKQKDGLWACHLFVLLLSVNKNNNMEFSMNKEQKDLIVALLGLESSRLTTALMGEKDKEEIRLVKAEREFVRKTILVVRGGK